MEKPTRDEMMKNLQVFVDHDNKDNEEGHEVELSFNYVLGLIEISTTWILSSILLKRVLAYCAAYSIEYWITQADGKVCLFIDD